MKKIFVNMTAGGIPILGLLSLLLHSACHKAIPPSVAAQEQQGALIVAPAESSQPKAEETPNEKKDDGKNEEAKKDDKDDDKNKTNVQLSDKVLADAHIKTAPAVEEILVAKLSVAGEIVADPDKSARVTSPVAGRLTHLAFKEGDTVQKGAVLAVVHVPELVKARAAQAASSARASVARSNADRLRELADKGFAAKQEAFNAEADATAFAREAQAGKDQLGAIGSGVEGSGSELTLRAPITGVITQRNAVVGQAITAEDAIASIVDLNEVWFLGRVYEKDLGRVALGRSVAIATTAFPNEAFAGKVEYLGREADPGARTFSARIRLKNDRGLLRVGLFGTATIDTSPSDSEATAMRIVVPRSAITEMDNKPVAFVKTGAKGNFEKRLVVLGAHDAHDVAIVAGINEGENVVVDGAFNVKSVFLKGTLGDDD